MYKLDAHHSQVLQSYTYYLDHTKTTLKSRIIFDRGASLDA